MAKRYYVYIPTSAARTLYVGVTNNLERRMYEHKHKVKSSSFVARYNVTQLVYYEETNDPRVAIEREKQIKGWLRAKKIALVNSMNPKWEDLSSHAVAGRTGPPRRASSRKTAERKATPSNHQWPKSSKSNIAVTTRAPGSVRAVRPRRSQKCAACVTTRSAVAAGS